MGSYENRIVPHLIHLSMRQRILVFVEHGRAPDLTVRRWQDRVTPMWKRLGGGCHLNRAIGELIETAGFRIERLETDYMQGLKPMAFMYEGSARLG